MQMYEEIHNQDYCSNLFTGEIVDFDENSALDIMATACVSFMLLITIIGISALIMTIPE